MTIKVLTNKTQEFCKVAETKSVVSLAVGEPCGQETPKSRSDPAGAEHSTPAGSGDFSFAITRRRFHLRLMIFLPFGEGRVTVRQLVVTLKPLHSGAVSRKWNSHHLPPSMYQRFMTSIAGLPQGVCELSCRPPLPFVSIFHQYRPSNHG